MPSWKKLITSGSDAILNTVTASFFTGSFKGDGSQLTGITSAVPNIYITTGSNTSLQSITGSLTITGSGLTVTGSVRATSFTGSFTGSLTGTSTTASFVSGAIFTSTNPALSASYALTASFALNIDTSSLVTTSSFNSYTSSINSFTSSINLYTQSLNSVTSSFTTTSSFNNYTSSINSFTSSINLYTQSLNSRTGSFITTGSSTATQAITGSLIVSGSGFRVTGSVNIRSGALIVSNSLDTANRFLIASNGQTVVGWGSAQLLRTDGTQTVNWGSTVLTNGEAYTTVNWGSSLLQIGPLTSSLNWGQRVLIADASSTVSEWSNTLRTNVGSPSTYQWRRNSTYPFSVGYDLSTFDTESVEDNIITSAGKININLEPGTPAPVINAMSNYGNNINLIQKSYMKIDYVMTDTDPIVTPPTWLRVGYLEIFSDRSNSPALAYSSSIKTDFGAVPDITYSNTDTQDNWATNTEIYFISTEPDPVSIYLKYNIWAM